MTLVPTPDKYFLTAGSAEGPTLLNAFDNALLAAGIGNTNLVRMSSILPPAAKLIEPVQLPYGALVPVAYATESCDIPDAEIAAAVACGVPLDESLPGVIMEHHSFTGKSECLQAAIDKVEAAFKHRKWKIAEIKTCADACIVRRAATVFAGVVLWK